MEAQLPSESCTLPSATFMPPFCTAGDTSLNPSSTIVPWSEAWFAPAIPEDDPAPGDETFAEENAPDTPGPDIQYSPEDPEDAPGPDTELTDSVPTDTELTEGSSPVTFSMELPG